MAEKRILEAVSTMSYGKLPRLEVDPTHVLPAGFCRSSGLPDLPMEDHYSFKGAYVTFPLQCHEAPKTLTHWSAAESYSHCPAGAPGHSSRTEKATCQSEMEGLKAHQRLAGTEKVNECIARERWASYLGHTGVIQQGWLQGYPSQQLSPAPAACSTLAAPKPVYRSHAYGTESGYSAKRALTFRMQMENYSKRLEWSSPSSSILPTGAESHGYSPGGSKKTSMAENGAARFRHRSKEGAVHSAGFVPYHKALEKCQGVQNGSSLNANYPSVSQKSNSESPVGSNSRKHMWSRLPPPSLPPPPPLSSSLLVNSKDLAYQERSPSCYPLGSYPLTSHEQMLLYHQSYVQTDKTNSVFALAACKGFGSASREDGQMFPGSYFQQTSRSYYPGHLESYLYQTVGPPPLTPSEELHSSREHEHPQNSTAKVEFAPKTPLSACTPPEKPAPAHSPWRSRGGLPNWCESSRVAREASTNSSRLQAFPSLHQGDRLSHCYNRVEKMEGNGCQKDLCPPEKVTEKEEESSENHKKFSVTYESRRESITPHKNEPGGCIIISDSPIASHNPYSKPALPKDVLKAPNVQPTSHLHWSPDNQLKGLRERCEGPSTSSPPMPVINNVFSLAPYQAYLEGSADLAELEATKSGQAEELLLKSRGNKSVENGFVPWTGSQRSTEESRVDLRREEGATCNTKSGEVDLNKNSLPIGQGGGGDYAGPWESFKMKLSNPTDPVSCQPSPANHSNDRVERLTQEDHVLDLSFKMEDSVEQPDLPQLPKKAEAPDLVGGPKIQGEEVKEKAANSCQGSVSQTNGETLVLPINNGDSRGNRHFHSSAAFLFKKFKVLKAHAAEAASGVKDVSLTKRTDSQVTQPNRPSVGPSLPQAAMPSQTLILQIKCLNAKLPNASTLLSPSAPPGSPALGEIQVLCPATEELLGQQKPPRQYFTALHTCVCTIISDSVSTSSPDQLKEWLEIVVPPAELQEKTVSSTKPKNSSKVSEGPKLSKGKEIWLAFKDVEVLVKKLQSQLEIFLLYNKCPFPHVMRAGATFIPIHVVKEELFSNLPGVSVDHILQDHKVELRPTTLSEERALRDLDLKSCTSRMLKLLALKQLPDIYLDLLTLHWHECVKQQLGDPVKLIPNSDVEALGTDATTDSLDQDFREKSTKGKTCGLAARFGTTPLHYETLQSEDKETLARCSSPSFQRGCVLKRVKMLPKEDAALETKGLTLCSGVRRPSHKQPRTLELKLTAKVARRTTRASKILHLRKSMVHIQFQNALQDIQGPQILGPPSGKRKKVPPPLLLKRFKRRRHSRAKVAPLSSEYPELVGKRIRHLYEEKDKTEAWYQGVVLRVHKPHKNPLKTLYEVKYDSEPEWQYYLEILQDYKKGWVELDE